MSEASHPGSDLADRADVEVLLRRFYGRVFDDDTLAEPFADLRVKGLDSHLRVMCDFWETVLFCAGLYHGNALLVHRQLYDRGPVAECAKVQAGRIARSMHRRLRGVDAGELDALAVR